MTAAIAPSAPIRAFPERRNDAARPADFRARLWHGENDCHAGSGAGLHPHGPCGAAVQIGAGLYRPRLSHRRRPPVNIDSWAMEAEMIRALTARASDADLVLAEGSMGLFDGVAQAGEHGTGASADIAALMGWPVVLVLDVSGQAQSAAAVARGFATMAAHTPIPRAILNRVASPRHEAPVRNGLEAAGITVFGALPRRE